MRLNTCLHSISGSRVPYPSHVFTACTGATLPSPVSTLLHSYHKKKKSLPKLTDMMTPIKPTTVKPTNNGQFVGCVDLALTINSGKWEMQHKSLNM